MIAQTSKYLDGFRRWVADGGKVKGELYQKWGKISFALNPSSDRSPLGIVATVQSLHSSLTAQEQTDWVTEEASLVSASAEILKVARGDFS